MSEINNAEQLRAWFRGCPAIQKQYRFDVDYAGKGPDGYSVFSVPSTLKYRENILGEEILDRIQVQNFIFASKQPYGEDAQQNLANLAFYQEVADWILEQNDARTFPKWDHGRVRSILPTITGAPVRMGAGVAKYQIQLRVTYVRT